MVEERPKEEVEDFSITIRKSKHTSTVPAKEVEESSQAKDMDER